MKEKDHVVHGALYILLAATGFACMSAIGKSVGTRIPNVEIVFFRNFFGLLILLPFLFFPTRKDLHTNFFLNHFARSLASVLALYCLFYSIQHILLADAMLLNNTMPLFVPFVMFFWKGEKIPKQIILPLIISFFGVILLLHPDKTIFHLAAIVALFSGVFMAISTVGVRILGKKEPFYRIMFYTLGISSILSALPLFWQWQTPTLKELLALLGLAFFGVIYQFSITKGYQLAHPTKISPLIYVAVILSGVFDWVFWGQAPDWLSYVGVVLVVIGAYYCTQIEGKIEERHKE